MADEHDDTQPLTAGAWAKKYYLAYRMVMESLLRPYGLGPTQWYVLHQLATVGATAQRDLVRMLQVERATLSGVVSALVSKGLIQQTAAAGDQRQKTLTITPAGTALWCELPDPIALLRHIAFDGVAAADIDTTARVLRAATARLSELLAEGTDT